MSETSVTVRPPTGKERERIPGLLRSNDLPAEDLEASPVQLFVCVDDEGLVAVGGFEPYGTEGLLRSIVVPAEKRGQGYGSVFCDRLVELAAGRGIETLYLLTTTAVDFFRNRGYDRCSREQVPAAVRETTQFALLCPDSAICLRKQIRSQQ